MPDEGGGPKGPWGVKKLSPTTLPRGLYEDCLGLHLESPCLPQAPESEL